MYSISEVLTRLLILWLLSEGPLHGYKIKKVLDHHSLSFWFPIEYASIYSVLRSLVKGGYVKVVAVEREGRRPERTRYAITSTGRDHLADLLARAWQELPNPAEPVQLALAARSELTQDRVAALVDLRIEALRQRLETLQLVGASAPAPEMVDRLTAITRAELEWAQKLRAMEGGNDSGI